MKKIISIVLAGLFLFGSNVFAANLNNLNGLTTSSQTFSTGTTNIRFNSSGSVHTFAFTKSLPVSNGGTGMKVLTTGQLLFGDTAASISQSAELFWDKTNNRLGVGTSTPASKLTVSGGLSVGSSYASITAPSNGLIVQGNVGVGVSSPSFKLDVLGQVNASGGLCIAGVCKLTWTDLASGSLNYIAKFTAQTSVGKSQIYDDGAGVGIGTTNTTGAKLKVAGVVESTTGGFKFPDGTTQTTAASTPNTNTKDADNILELFLENYFSGKTTPNRNIFFDGFSDTTKADLLTATTIDTTNKKLLLGSSGSSSASVQVLVVAGGGGGGKADANFGAGGGGAGRYYYDADVSVTAQAYTVTVGGGSSGSTSNTARGGTGGNSSFGSLITTVGGGGGGSGWMAGDSVPSGGAGGSGGGAGSSNPASSGGTGSDGAGTPGGLGNNGASQINAGSGGGGSSSAGTGGGAGGAGTSNSIAGSSITYAAGGSGSGSGSAGAANTGNGGNGGSPNQGNGGAGGSGIVVIRYATGTITASGGTITTDGAYTVHTFNSSGTFSVDIPSSIGSYQSTLTSLQLGKKTAAVWVVRNWTARFNLATSIAQSATSLTVSGDQREKFASGDAIDIYSSDNLVRERKTLSLAPSYASGSNQTTLTFTPSISNSSGFGTGAYVERVDVIPQVSLVNKGGATSYAAATYKSSIVDFTNNEVKDEYEYVGAQAEEDFRVKLNLSRNDLDLIPYARKVLVQLGD